MTVALIYKAIHNVLSEQGVGIKVFGLQSGFNNSTQMGQKIILVQFSGFNFGWLGFIIRFNFGLLISGCNTVWITKWFGFINRVWVDTDQL